ARPAGHRRRDARHGRPSAEIRPRTDARRAALMLCWGMATTVSLPEADYTDTFRRRRRRVSHGRGVGAGSPGAASSSNSVSSPLSGSSNPVTVGWTLSYWFSGAAETGSPATQVAATSAGEASAKVLA